jgi:hypothetical protein
MWRLMEARAILRIDFPAARFRLSDVLRPARVQRAGADRRTDSVHDGATCRKGRASTRRTRTSLEQLATARLVRAHLAIVELTAELGDASIDLGEGEEGLVAKTCEDPTLSTATSTLDLSRGLRGRAGKIVVMWWRAQSSKVFCTPGSYLHATVTADLSWSGTTAFGMPPMNASARVLLASQSGNRWVYVASANVAVLLSLVSPCGPAARRPMRPRLRP